MVIGHWSLVIGHWSLVIGHWSLVREEVIGGWGWAWDHESAVSKQRKRKRRDFGLGDGRLDVGGVFFVSDFVLGIQWLEIS